MIATNEVDIQSAGGQSESLGTDEENEEKCSTADDESKVERIPENQEFDTRDASNDPNRDTRLNSSDDEDNMQPEASSVTYTSLNMDIDFPDNFVAALADIKKYVPEEQFEKACRQLQTRAHKDDLSTQELQVSSTNTESIACKWMYDFYKSNDEKLQQFVIQFLPALIMIYFARPGQVTTDVAALLHGIYHELRKQTKSSNTSVLFPIVDVPNIEQSSVYHYADKMSKTFSLTEDTLESHNISLDQSRRIQVPQIPRIKRVNHRNKLILAHCCLALYVYHLSDMPSTSQKQFCAVCSRLAGSGLYTKDSRFMADESNSNRDVGIMRYSLSTDLFHQFVAGLAFCISWATTRAPAVGAVCVVHERAVQDLNCEVMLQTTCVLNKL